MNWILSILLILILWSFIERKFLGVSRYKITTRKLGTIKEPIHIVVLADLHNQSFGKRNLRLLQRIERLEPDLIIAAGDIITKRKRCYPSNAYNLLKQLSEKYRVYYAFGNHELYFDLLKAEPDKSTSRSPGHTSNSQEAFLYNTWLKYLENLKALGVHILKNESQTIKIKNCSLRITGLNLEKEYYPKGKSAQVKEFKLSDLIGKSGEEYQILIAHNPMFYKEYIRWGADLTLAGHIHGGLMRLPLIGGIISPQYKFFPKYDAGVFTETAGSMVVSRGLGSHSIMLRLFNPPDLVSIKLDAMNKTIY